MTSPGTSGSWRAAWTSSPAPAAAARHVRSGTSAGSAKPSSLLSREVGGKVTVDLLCKFVRCLLGSRFLLKHLHDAFLETVVDVVAGWHPDALELRVACLHLVDGDLKERVLFLIALEFFHRIGSRIDREVAGGDMPCELLLGGRRKLDKLPDIILLAALVVERIERPSADVDAAGGLFIDFRKRGDAKRELLSDHLHDGGELAGRGEDHCCPSAGKTCRGATRGILQCACIIQFLPFPQERDHRSILSEDHFRRDAIVSVVLVTDQGKTMLLAEPCAEFIRCRHAAECVAGDVSVLVFLEQKGSVFRHLVQALWRFRDVRFFECVLVVIEQDGGAVERHADHLAFVGLGEPCRFHDVGEVVSVCFRKIFHADERRVVPDVKHCLCVQLDKVGKIRRGAALPDGFHFGQHVTCFSLVDTLHGNAFFFADRVVELFDQAVRRISRKA